MSAPCGSQGVQQTQVVTLGHYFNTKGSRDPGSRLPSWFKQPKNLVPVCFSSPFGRLCLTEICDPTVPAGVPASLALASSPRCSLHLHRPRSLFDCCPSPPVVRRRPRLPASPPPSPASPPRPPPRVLLPSSPRARRPSQSPRPSPITTQFPAAIREPQSLLNIWLGRDHLSTIGSASPGKRLSIMINAFAWGFGTRVDREGKPVKSYACESEERSGEMSEMVRGKRAERVT
ncbi:hypothetical protein Syun_031366 [Stephania yunnanensis]|uniref:Uncharacterized protein n=1 Tax=Stephania yunnanensis TaxID=152371 RepID=A0AAP0E144_9MAGN